MIQVTDEKEVYLSHFADLQQGPNERSLPGFIPCEETAMTSFEKLGFPTVHDEEWRFTNVAPIAKWTFKPAALSSQKLPLKKIQPWILGQWKSHRLVFVNGVFSAELSALQSLPSGVILGSLSQALNTHAGLLEPHLARYIPFEKDSFAALNTAFLHDGAFIYIPRGAVLEEPIHILYHNNNRFA